MGWTKWMSEAEREAHAVFVAGRAGQGRDLELELTPSRAG
jgi:hypothetical protein